MNRIPQADECMRPDCTARLDRGSLPHFLSPPHERRPCSDRAWIDLCQLQSTVEGPPAGVRWHSARCSTSHLDQQRFSDSCDSNSVEGRRVGTLNDQLACTLASEFGHHPDSGTSLSNLANSLLDFAACCVFSSGASCSEVDAKSLRYIDRGSGKLPKCCS